METLISLFESLFSSTTSKYIFPSIPNKKKFLFIPILIDENKKDLLNFSNNSIYNKWNDFLKSYHLIEYILPQDDLEDINFIKKNFDIIEQYDFKDITKKYLLKDSIILLIFKNKNEIRVLSRITIKDSVTLKNQSFLNIDIKKEDQIEKIIYELKLIYRRL